MLLSLCVNFNSIYFQSSTSSFLSAWNFFIFFKQSKSIPRYWRVKLKNSRDFSPLFQKYTVRCERWERTRFFLFSRWNNGNILLLKYRYTYITVYNVNCHYLLLNSHRCFTASPLFKYNICHHRAIWISFGKVSLTQINVVLQLGRIKNKVRTEYVSCCFKISLNDTFND